MQIYLVDNKLWNTIDHNPVKLFNNSVKSIKICVNLDISMYV